MGKYKAFLDANIWFSAALSSSGGSFLICRLAEEGLIQAFASNHVLEEAERNLLLKAPKQLSSYFKLLKQLDPEIRNVRVSDVLRRDLDGIMPAKDIPVIAGALDTRADFLISLDKKHILRPELKALNWPFKIVSTKEFLEIIKKDFKNF